MTALPIFLYTLLSFSGIIIVYISFKWHKTHRELALFKQIDVLYPIGLAILDRDFEIKHMNFYLRQFLKTKSDTPAKEVLQIPGIIDTIQRGLSTQKILINQQVYHIHIQSARIEHHPFYCIFYTPSSETPVTDSCFKDYSKALRMMALGLAHELKNPITSIQMLIQMKTQNGTPNALRPDAEYNTIIAYESDRLNRILQEFLNYADTTSLHSSPIKLHDTMEEALDIVQKTLRPKSLNVKKSFFPAPAILLDKPKILQALVHLLTNAFEAAPTYSGEIAIKIRKVTPFVELTITDNGEGIPKDRLHKIFHPFFTTKKDGTGLGLSIAEKIIRDHGGELNCESVPGQSTTFTVLLPIQSATTPPITILETLQDSRN